MAVFLLRCCQCQLQGRLRQLHLYLCCCCCRRLPLLHRQLVEVWQEVWCQQQHRHHPQGEMVGWVLVLAGVLLVMAFV